MNPAGPLRWVKMLLKATIAYVGVIVAQDVHSWAEWRRALPAAIFAVLVTIDSFLSEPRNGGAAPQPVTITDQRLPVPVDTTPGADTEPSRELPAQ